MRWQGARSGPLRCRPTGRAQGVVISPVSGSTLSGLARFCSALARSGSAAGGLFEAIAVAVHGQDADVVGEAVEQGTGEALGAEHREHAGPFLNGSPIRRRAIAAPIRSASQQISARRVAASFPRTDLIKTELINLGHLQRDSSNVTINRLPRYDPLLPNKP